jgi:uncharacterized protein (TIRG00374 family)
MFSGRLKYFSPKQMVLYLLSVSVSVAVFFYLQATISLDELGAILRQVSPLGLALFVVFSLTMSVFRTWRYALLLRISGHAANNQVLFLITLVRNLFSDLLPARLGTLIYIYLARTRMGVSWSSASASFAYSFIFDILSLGFLILLAASAALGLSGHPGLLMLVGLLLSACSGGILFLLPKQLDRGLTHLPQLLFLKESLRMRIDSGLQEFRIELLCLQKSGMLIRVLVLSFGVRCCKYLSLYCLLLALVLPLGYTPVDFPLTKVFFGLTAAEMAASLPISGIAGFGAYEGAWSLVFQLLGYSEKLSALTSVSHHLLTQVFGYSLGGIAFLLLLLPWPGTNRSSASTIRQNRGGSISFYLRSLLLLLVPLLCVLLILSVNPAPQRAYSANMTLSQDLPTNSVEIPAGKVAFQRPDGIYTVSVGSGKRDATRLHTSGRTPRWSPDGRHIAFIDGNRIMIMNARGKELRELTTTAKGKALCFHPDGRRVLYTDRKTIKAVNIKTGTITTLANGNEFFELDISHDGAILVATEKKTLGGYRVVAIDLAKKNRHTVSRGCSASISPAGSTITVNTSDHRELLLFDRKDNKQVASVKMIEGKTFDNQYWANHPDWIASKSEGEFEDIYLHHISSSAGFQVTFLGHSDRPDYFILP